MRDVTGREGGGEDWLLAISVGVECGWEAELLGEWSEGLDFWAEEGLL